MRALNTAIYTPLLPIKTICNTQEHKTQVPLTCWPALAAKEYINRVVEFNIYCINDNNTSLLNGDGHNDQITHTHTT